MLILRDLPLTSSPVGWLLGTLLVAAVLRLIWRACSLRRLAIVVVGSAAVVALGRHFLPASVDVARIPPTMYVWTALVLALGGLVASRWFQAGWGWRSMGLLTVAMAALLGLQQADAWFAYVPTVADLIRAPLPNQASLTQLQAPDRALRFPRGAVVPVDLPATSSGFRHRSALVWVPPAALAGDGPVSSFGDGGRRPIVMLLAGTPGAPDDMVRAGNFANVAARYARTHNGEAPIVVMPDHNGGFDADSECVGWHGQAEQYLTNDVPADVSTLFGTRSTNWGVIGYSEGGTCALMLSLRHPDLYPAFVDIGGDQRPNLGSSPKRDRLATNRFYGDSIVTADEHDPRYLLDHHSFADVHGWFITGQSDLPARRAAESLVPAATGAGIDLRWTTPPGHHSFSLVNTVSDEAFSWVVGQLPVPMNQNPL